MKFLRNRTVLGILCIVLSLVICFGLTPLYTHSISAKTNVLQVVSDIQKGDVITENMIQTVEVGKQNLPENLLHKVDTVIGKYATADLQPGDFILSTKLSKAPAEDNAYLSHLDGSKQAISITVKSFASGLSGKLQAGDIVSVIAPDFRKTGETVIPPELQYVEVIAVTDGNGYDANTGKTVEEYEEKELPATATLLVTNEQAKILTELEATGTHHLSLIYRGESEKASEFLSAQDTVLNDLYAPDVPEEISELQETTEQNEVA